MLYLLYKIGVIKITKIKLILFFKKSLFDGLEEEDPILNEAFQPRTNAKRLVLRAKSETNSPIQYITQSTDKTARDANSHSADKTVDANNISDANIYNNNTEITDKENHSQDNNRLSNDRRSSTSW